MSTEQTTQATPESANPVAPAAEATTETQEVKFRQPEKGKHEYVSVDPEGYTVHIHADKKTWSASGPQGVIGNKYKNRIEAFNAANDHAFPKEGSGNGGAASPGDTTSPLPKDPKKPSITGREYSVLKMLDDEGSAVSVVDIAKKTEFDQAVVYTVIGGLSRRRFVTLSGDGSMITSVGKEAIATYSPTPRQLAGGGSKTRTPEQIEAALIAKNGPRPEGIGPRPTNLEIAEARLNNAKASLEFAKIVQRLHPYSVVMVKRIKTQTERVEIAQKAFEDASKGIQTSEPTENEATPSE